jgi:methionine-gamma-lyase
MFLAENFEKDGLEVKYPGLKSHKHHELFKKMMHTEYGFGGLMAIDFGTTEKANELLELMQTENLGYLAVSLGFYKTLFSVSGTSTSSEIPEEEQKEMGLSPGLTRFSIGLDHDIQRTYEKMKWCMKKVGVL